MTKLIIIDPVVISECERAVSFTKKVAELSARGVQVCLLTSIDYSHYEHNSALFELFRKLPTISEAGLLRRGLVKTDGYSNLDIDKPGNDGVVFIGYEGNSRTYVNYSAANRIFLYDRRRNHKLKGAIHLGAAQKEDLTELLHQALLKLKVKLTVDEMRYIYRNIYRGGFISTNSIFGFTLFGKKNKLGALKSLNNQKDNNAAQKVLSAVRKGEIMSISAAFKYFLVQQVTALKKDDNKDLRDASKMSEGERAGRQYFLITEQREYFQQFLGSNISDLSVEDVDFVSPTTSTAPQ